MGETEREPSLLLLPLPLPKLPPVRGLERGVVCLFSLVGRGVCVASRSSHSLLFPLTRLPLPSSS